MLNIMESTPVHADTDVVIVHFLHNTVITFRYLHPYHVITNLIRVVIVVIEYNYCPLSSFQVIVSFGPILFF
jgi:hypothetical protein